MRRALLSLALPAVLFPALGVFAQVNYGSATNTELDPHKKYPVSIILDKSGVTHKVTDLRIFVRQGKWQSYARTLPLIVGHAKIDVSFDDIACITKDMLADSPGKVRIVLCNKQQLTGELKFQADIVEFTGSALAGGMKLPFSIPVERVEWILQVEPPVPGVLLKDGRIVIQNPVGK